MLRTSLYFAEPLGSATTLEEIGGYISVSREKLSRMNVILDDDLRVTFDQGLCSTDWRNFYSSELCQCSDGDILNCTSISLIVSVDYEEPLD